MASLEDLKSVLRETLEQKGVLNKVKAEIRAEIFTALDADNQGKPAVP
jgi:lisH domain-containing protein FOPNL